MKILVTMPKSGVRDGFLPPRVVKKLESIGEVEWNETSGNFSPGELKDRIKDVEVCIAGWGSARFDEEVLKDADRLKVIAYTGGSVANIVSDYLYEKGITVLSGNEIYAESVAEGVLTYILTSLRRVIYFQNQIFEGNWPPTEAWDEGILDQSIGLIGFGAVARYLTRMLEPFRVKVYAYDPYVDDEVLNSHGVERAGMEEIFANCKIISVHAAKTPETYHLIGKKQLESIQDGGLFVNTARASIVDTEALIGELLKNRFNAVIDVFDEEPLPADSPLIGLPNVLLQPHRGGPTTDRWEIVTLNLIEDTLRVFAGEKARLEIKKEYAMAMTQ
ncbi:MAG: hydroxyacid dehydrogenase [Clostridiales bacterium]|jgi:phosphoglycerate dehydrogenase-like enzyme|nr:hydroxyacid dehydrogenase [Clostridiales bacterium]